LSFLRSSSHYHPRCSHFFVAIRLALRSPLFPYTTLFRSFAMFYSNKNFLDQYLGNDLAKRYSLWYARYTDTFDGTDCDMWQYTRDRKSTRLNSSHVSISYAVFCLKQKIHETSIGSDLRHT